MRKRNAPIEDAAHSLTRSRLTARLIEGNRRVWAARSGRGSVPDLGMGAGRPRMLGIIVQMLRVKTECGGAWTLPT
jgi:hypothetical protein